MRLKGNSNIDENCIHRLTNQDTNTERFMFGDFKSDEHCICIWDEFRLPNSIKCFKQIVAGETTSTDRKNKETIKICFRVPIIMISNTSFCDLLEECYSEPGVEQRLFPVEAKSKPYKVQRRTEIEEEIVNLKRKKH